MADPISPGKKTKLLAQKMDLKILDITDKLDDKYMGGKSAVNFKTLEYIKEYAIIKIEVKGVTQKVSMWIEYEPSTIHDDFYKQYKKGDFAPPIVAKGLKDKELKPGVYKYAWGGRDQTEHKRLLLAGKYLLKIKGKYKTFEKSAEAKVTVAKPEAYNYGVHYKKHGSLESSKKDVGYAEKGQKSLKDGTGYDVMSQYDRNGQEAVEEWKTAGVIYFSGHSNPMAITLHSKEGGNYKRKDRANIFMKMYKGANTVKDGFIFKQKAGAFKDLLFIMLNGCRSANETLTYQQIVSAFNPKGIDGDHGPRTIEALDYFQHYHNLLPVGGQINKATLEWFKIPEELPKEDQTREIQKTLTSFYAGKSDGKFGGKTKKSVKNYQTAHAKLKVTEILDEETLKALFIGNIASGTEVPANIANAMNYRGADLTLGFIHKVQWKESADWTKSFWDNLAKGQGMNTAASNAQASIDHRKRKIYEYRLYALKGISKETTLHPARYGATKESGK